MTVIMILIIILDNVLYILMGTVVMGPAVTEYGISLSGAIIIFNPANAQRVCQGHRPK